MLSSVDVTASGVYYCTAINNGHNATASITLNVNSKSIYMYYMYNYIYYMYYNVFGACTNIISLLIL